MKSSVSDPSNFHPISLTSTFRKILKCLYSTLEGESPDLDIAQGGFRSSRSTLDQTLCLVETCSILRRKHKTTPTLAFLDIKSAYDTVDREHIWNTLQPTASPELLGLLRNLFDDVHIEVIVSNASSYRFSPTTGVLQVSILSPFLYSLYINELPSLLRSQALDAVPTTNNPSKCAILAPGSDTRSYSLYGTVLPRQTSLSHLGIPISPGGYLNTNELVQNNINKALQTMNQMSAIGVNHKGFNQLLSVRFYTLIVRSQLEYGLAISAVSSSNITKFETCQTQCIRRIFGGGSRSSTKIMLHLTNQPTMKERVHRLQAKFLFRSINAPEDTLLSQLLAYLRTYASLSQWYKISKTPLWQRCCASHEIDDLDSRTFNTIYHEYLKDNLNARRNATNSLLLSACRSKLGIDPIL
ncbi:hypothetical protein G6F44_008640 [Rhizopus delemar]|nr:hypothetical protein G6F44_008640 [Rhizopus delemar]